MINVLTNMKQHTQVLVHMQLVVALILGASHSLQYFLQLKPTSKALDSLVLEPRLTCSTKLVWASWGAVMLVWTKIKCWWTGFCFLHKPSTLFSAWYLALLIIQAIKEPLWHFCYQPSKLSSPISKLHHHHAWPRETYKYHKMTFLSVTGMYTCVYISDLPGVCTCCMY